LFIEEWRILCIVGVVLGGFKLFIKYYNIIMIREKFFNNDWIKHNTQEIQILKKYFPWCFDREGNFLIEKFKAIILNSWTNISQEYYGLEWLWKNYSRLLANLKTQTLLQEDKNWNSKSENINSENLLIKWDNLDVLKHLVNAYRESIKMIYIDPPYNTWNDDFLYKDNRNFTPEELAELAWISEEKAEKILSYFEKWSRSHSAWLTFMYPRLYIARQLLRDDWVIFVSIDDNEIAQLKLMMDEIFGEENFVTIFKWNKTSTPPSLSSKIRQKYEYILCYEKNYSSQIYNWGITSWWDMPLLNDSNEEKILIFPKEVVKFNINWIFKKWKYWRIELLNDIEIKNWISNKDLKLKWRFKWIQETLYKEIKNWTIFVIKSDNFAIRYLRTWERIKKPSDVISKTECWVWTNEDAKREIDNYFLRNFSDKLYPKPTSLIKYLTQLITSEWDIVLDFFAWSWTTGDAVMQLNAEDWGNRKFILVQLPEPIDPKKNKVAYDFVKNELWIENPTIFDITKERLIRAAKKIKEEKINPKIKQLKEKLTELQNQLNLESKDEEIQKIQQQIQNLQNQDLWFKIFETVPLWEDYFENLDKLDEDTNQQLELFENLSEKDLENLLTTWKVYDGIKLTENLDTIDLDWYKAFYHQEKEIIYFIYKWFSINNLKAFIKKIDEEENFLPLKIVIWWYNFESKVLREINEGLKNYLNKKWITNFTIITRY